MVPFAAAVESERLLREVAGCGANLRLRAYEGLAHRTNADEIRDVFEFLDRHLPRHDGDINGDGGSGGGGGGGGGSARREL